jgi:hypothetical protein
VLLAEKIVELGEEGDVAGSSEDDVEVELGVAEVEVAVGEEERVAVIAVGVESSLRSASAPWTAAEKRGVVYWTAKKPVLGGRRKGRLLTRGESAPMGMPGRLGLVAGAALSLEKDCSTSEAR